jgi:HK97 family phage major capsid protein/HK97 family phage prohead protease
VTGPSKLCLRSVEFRAAESDNNDGRTLEGYAAVFNAPTDIDSFEGRFSEEIAPGAFRKTINERKPVLQFDHGKDVRTGSVPIGKIVEMREDPQGLYVKARLFDNPVVEPIRQAIEGGAISGMSFRFRAVRDEWRDGDGNVIKPGQLGEMLYNAGSRGPLKRTLKEVQLFEAGPVVFPAYEQTSVGVRSIDELTDEERQSLIDDYARTFEECEHRWADALIEDKPTQVFCEGCGEVRADSMKKPEEPYGDVNYADPGYQKDKKKRYPLDSAEHAKAAWSYINQADNAAEYSADQLAEIKGKIKAALKKFGVDVEAKAADDVSSTPEDPGADPTVTPDEQVISSNTREKDKNMSEPMTVEERVARQSEIKARLSEIDTEYSGGTLPEDTQREWDNLNEEFGEHDDAIEAATRRAAQLRALAEDNAAKGGTGRSVERGTAPNVIRRPENIYDLSNLRNQARSLDEMGQLCRDNAMRAIEQGRFGYGIRKEDAQSNVERLLLEADDAQGTLARRILQTGSPVYERAFGKAMKALNTNGLTAEEARALSLGSNADGGYAVPFQLDPTVILTSDGVINPLRSMARVVQITGKEWQGLTSAGISVTRSTEASEVSEQSPQFEQPTVRPSRVTGFIPFSVEIDADWSAMRSEVTRLLQDAKDTEEAGSFVNGDGTGVNPGGVLRTLSHYAAVPDGGTLSSADIYALEEALSPRFRSRAQFLANKSVYNDIRQLGTTDGTDLWVRLADRNPSQLIGYDAREISTMGGATGTNRYLLFGDFSQFLIVDRVGMNVELVPHLFATANNRPSGQRGLLAIWRNSSKVLVDDAFRYLVHGTAS